MSESSVAARALQLAASAAPGADVEISVGRSRLALTRFANSVIHQNVAEDTTMIRVRVHLDGRTMSGSTTRIDGDGLGALVDRTLAAARVAPADPGWPGVAPSEAVGVAPAADAATVDASPRDRAGLVRAFVDAARGMETAGYCRTFHWSGAFCNSAGHVAVAETAEAAIDGIARRSGVDGVARAVSNRIGDLDGAVLGARAAAKADAGGDAVELPPGRYEVVLEPTAVADVLSNVAMYAFNAKAIGERRSFVERGAAQFDPSLTLVDDALACGLTYDAEGSPRAATTLVDAGTIIAVTHDRRTAAEVDDRSTGHATGTAWGPFALHLGIHPGPGGAISGEVEGPAADSAVLALVDGMSRGVLVSDLWYTRVLDQKTLAITGLTRNGVWLVEDGEITRPVSNFRFTQSYAEALAPGAVSRVGDTVEAQPSAWLSARWSAPALRLASWNFTGGASG